MQKYSVQTIFWFLTSVIVGVGWAVFAISLEAVAHVIYLTTWLVCCLGGGISWWRWQQMSKKTSGLQLTTGEHIPLWAAGFRIWFTVNHLLFAGLLLGLGGVMLTLFGYQNWILVLLAGVVAGALTGLTGFFVTKTSPFLELCWRSQCPAGIRNPLNYFGCAFLLKTRFERVYQDHSDGDHQRVVDWVTALQNAKTDEPGYLIPLTDLKQQSYNKALSHRIRGAALPFIVAALIFLLLVILGWLPERPYAPFNSDTSFASNSAGESTGNGSGQGESSGSAGDQEGESEGQGESSGSEGGGEGEGQGESSGSAGDGEGEGQGESSGSEGGGGGEGQGESSGSAGDGGGEGQGESSGSEGDGEGQGESSGSEGEGEGQGGSSGSEGEGEGQGESSGSGGGDGSTANEKQTYLGSEKTKAEDQILARIEDSGKIIELKLPELTPVATPADPLEQEQDEKGVIHAKTDQRDVTGHKEVEVVEANQRLPAWIVKLLEKEREGK